MAGGDTREGLGVNLSGLVLFSVTAKPKTEWMPGFESEDPLEKIEADPRRASLLGSLW